LLDQADLPAAVKAIAEATSETQQGADTVKEILAANPVKTATAAATASTATAAKAGKAGKGTGGAAAKNNGKNQNKREVLRWARRMADADVA